MNLINSRAKISNTEFMQIPTPPDGYRLVKGEEIKECIPYGAKVLGDDGEWRPSSYTGCECPSAALDAFYAIPNTVSTSVIVEAKSIVAGERQTDYGDAKESFGRIAELWSAYAGIEITSWDVAQMMILLKVSRAKTSRKRDTLVDIVGYAECAGKLEDSK